MELSMWIIADRLKRFLPEIEIASGKMEIRGARLLTGAEQIRDDMLYIAPLGDAGRVLCRHGNDRLYLNTADHEAVMNAVLDAFDEFQRWNEVLRAAVLRGGSIQERLDLSRGTLPLPLFVADSFGNVVGYSAGFESLAAEDPYWSCIVQERHMSDRLFFDTWQSDSGAEAEDWNNSAHICQTEQGRIVSLNLSVREEIVGKLIIAEADGQLTAGVCQLAEIFSGAIADTLAAQGGQRRAARRDEHAGKLSGQQARDHRPALGPYLRVHGKTGGRGAGAGASEIRFPFGQAVQPQSGIPHRKLHRRLLRSGFPRLCRCDPVLREGGAAAYGVVEDAAPGGIPLRDIAPVFRRERDAARRQPGGAGAPVWESDPAVRESLHRPRVRILSEQARRR